MSGKTMKKKKAHLSHLPSIKSIRQSDLLLVAPSSLKDFIKVIELMDFRMLPHDRVPCFKAPEDHQEMDHRCLHQMKSLKRISTQKLR